MRLTLLLALAGCLLMLGSCRSNSPAAPTGLGPSVPWIQTYGQFDVYSFAVIGKNLFAGTDAGVFLSTDEGVNWTAMNLGLTKTYVKSLCVSGTNLCAGTNGGGVFLSTNSGGSWNAVNTGLTNQIVASLGDFEGQFDMHLNYFDRSWTVSKWEASWNREKPDLDWMAPMNLFAHKVALLVDKITEK